MKLRDRFWERVTTNKATRRLFSFYTKGLFFFSFFSFLLGCQEAAPPNGNLTMHKSSKPLMIQTADSALHQCLQFQSPSLSGKSYRFQAKNTCVDALKCNVFLHYTCTTSHTKTAMTFVPLHQIQANQQILLQKNLQSCKGSVQVLAHRARCMRKS